MSRYQARMWTRGLTILFACVFVAGCASSLPVQDFRSDYQRPTARGTAKVQGYPLFAVAELREQRRIRVMVVPMVAAFSVPANPLVMAGLSDGIPPVSAHQAAAQVFLAEHGRPGCTVEPVAVSPSGREFEFRYTCPPRS
jgi:hypothetical protein